MSISVLTVLQQVSNLIAVNETKKQMLIDHVMISNYLETRGC